MAIEVNFSGAGRDDGRWFDDQVNNVRTWRGWMTDAEIATLLVTEKGATPGQAWLLVCAAKVMDS